MLSLVQEHKHIVRKMNCKGMFKLNFQMKTQNDFYFYSLGVVHPQLTKGLSSVPGTTGLSV